MSNTVLRALLTALLAWVAVPAAAQSQPPAQPPGLQPVPEPPPPPPGYELDPALEPQVTILKRGTDTVEEYRIAGRLYMIKVTPAHGAPYYMIDRLGDGKFVRDDNLGANIRPPMWLLFTF
ncbi:MAG: DUF2782 domain-containing protein [Burkholderiales bacterium]|nr:DUF2782 domain-containing protein [Burkholderiales bacterium]